MLLMSLIIEKWLQALERLLLNTNFKLEWAAIVTKMRKEETKEINS